MITIRKGIALVSIAISLSACSPKIPFTQAIREQNNLTAEELKQIQFYISDPVVLRRGEEKSKQKTTEEGTLILKSGKDVEEVVFKSNTPGAVTEVGDNQNLKVAFEDGAEKNLVFGSNDRDKSGYYYLKALSWPNGKGKINYGGQTYFSNVGSDRTVLLFKMKSLRNVKVDQKVVKGKKVN